MNKKARLFLPCYYAFVANGMMALVVGAVLPYLIEETGINYSVAGGLLSAFAIGNLIASFINPPAAKALGRKYSIILLSLLIPIDLLIIASLAPVPVLYAAFVLLGIGRGSVSITNNMVVNDCDGTPRALNMLHTSFAVGALLAPFLTGVFIQNGLGWKGIVYTIMILCGISCIGYIFMPLENKKEEAKQKTTEKISFNNIDFYIVGFILFFYLGAENALNGWFVTYFKSTGIMSDTYATNLVSITWVMILVGRLMTAYISNKISKQKLILINCVCTAACFVLLVSTHSLVVITIAEAGLGFFLAGIYPTGISNAGQYVKGSTTAMSILLAIAALGGIITPQIIGIAADHIGLVGAILVLSFNVTAMIILSIVNMIRNQKHTINN